MRSPFKLNVEEFDRISLDFHIKKEKSKRSGNYQFNPNAQVKIQMAMMESALGLNTSKEYEKFEKQKVEIINRL